MGHSRTRTSATPRADVGPPWRQTPATAPPWGTSQLGSGPCPYRRPLFAEKRMAARQGVNAAASGKCSFPRAGAAAGRAWVQWTQHACCRGEPLARRGLQDRRGWGSNAGTALAEFRPPPQPSPCPGAGARTSAARPLEPRSRFTMQNVLFLMSGPAFDSSLRPDQADAAAASPQGSIIASISSF